MKTIFRSILLSKNLFCRMRMN